MFSHVIDGIKQLVFPDNCVLCHTFLNSNHERQLCDLCLSKIKLNTPPFCLRCPRHLDAFSPDGLCASCIKQPYAFDCGWSACVYGEPLDQLLHNFKYKGKTALHKTFNPLIHDLIETYHIPIERFDMVIPMPLHPVRLRERGYNQSHILALNISQQNKIPLKENIIQRVRHTPTQTAFEAKQRWTNLGGAFTISHSKYVADKHILLVDDLMTTGATAHAAALCLKQAGAAQVGLLTLAVVN